MYYFFYFFNLLTTSLSRANFCFSFFASYERSKPANIVWAKSMPEENQAFS